MANGTGGIVELAPGLVLHLLRAGAFFSLAPAFGADASSKMLRLILAVSLGTIMWWTGGRTVAMPGSLPELALLCGREVCIGMLCGFALRSVTILLEIAGEVISNEMGFSMARVLDPETGVGSTAMAQLFEVMGLLLIFQLDLHHEVLHALQRTYELVPVGQGFDFPLVYQRAASLVTRSIDLGLHYAMPVFGVMILVTVVLVVLARAVPNINLMEFSFGLRILLAFAASIYFLIEGMPFLERVFSGLILESQSLFVGA